MGRMKMLALCGLFATITGCSLFMAKEARYLMSAKNKATQAEVNEALGKPVETKTMPSGEVLWVYQVRDLQPGNRMSVPGVWCDEYVLTFDPKGTLRDWIHRSYFHGGEVMPTYCVPDGFSAKP